MILSDAIIIGICIPLSFVHSPSLSGFWLFLFSLSFPPSTNILQYFLCNAAVCWSRNAPYAIDSNRGKRKHSIFQDQDSICRIVMTHVLMLAPRGSSKEWFLPTGACGIIIERQTPIYFVTHWSPVTIHHHHADWSASIIVIVDGGPVVYNVSLILFERDARTALHNSDRKLWEGDSW